MPGIVDTFYNTLPGKVVAIIVTDSQFDDYTTFTYNVSESAVGTFLLEDNGVIIVDVMANNPNRYNAGRAGVPDHKHSVEIQISIQVIIVKSSKGAYTDVYEFADAQVKSDLGIIERLFLAQANSLIQGDAGDTPNWAAELSLNRSAWGPLQISVDDDTQQFRNATLVLNARIQIDVE